MKWRSPEHRVKYPSARLPISEWTWIGRVGAGRRSDAKLLFLVPATSFGQKYSSFFRCSTVVAVEGSFAFGNLRDHFYHARLA